MACFHFRVELFENSYNERCMKMWIYVIAKKEYCIFRSMKAKKLRCQLLNKDIEIRTHFAFTALF